MSARKKSQNGAKRQQVAADANEDNKSDCRRATSRKKDRRRNSSEEEVGESSCYRKGDKLTIIAQSFGHIWGSFSACLVRPSRVCPQSKGRFSANVGPNLDNHPPIAKTSRPPAALAYRRRSPPALQDPRHLPFSSHPIFTSPPPPLLFSTPCSWAATARLPPPPHVSRHHLNMDRGQADKSPLDQLEAQVNLVVRSLALSDWFLNQDSILY